MTDVTVRLDDLDGDEEALFALRDSPGWVVASEVMHGDQLGFDELGVVALKFLSRFLEGFFDGATYAGRLGSDGHARLFGRFPEVPLSERVMGVVVLENAPYPNRDVEASRSEEAMTEEVAQDEEIYPGFPKMSREGVT